MSLILDYFNMDYFGLYVVITSNLHFHIFNINLNICVYKFDSYVDPEKKGVFFLQDLNIIPSYSD